MVEPLTDVDVVVIGAGIHGCGAAQAFAVAGHSVLLLEKSDIAAGTSSRSSKLIHGGLRYLETARLRLVRESLRERHLLSSRLAPGLVQPVPMHVPVREGMRRSRWHLHAGLSIYGLLGGGAYRTVPKADWGQLDGLDTEGLKAVFRYEEAQVDDAALCVAVLDSARAFGAQVLTGTTFEGATISQGGCEVRMIASDGARSATCKVIVNAAGPWATAVDRRIDGPMPEVPVELMQGAHVEYPGILVNGAYYVESPMDGRPVFVMPYRGRTLVGTTETVFIGDPDDVAPTPDEISYLHETFARHFPAKTKVSPAAAWAGLRVLPASRLDANLRSRETIYSVDDTRRPRVLSVYGGKLTTYRATARQVLRRLRGSLPKRRALGDTARLPLG